MAKAPLRRGFVKEANSWAADLRREMKVALDAPLCPRKLSEHLHVSVLSLSNLPACQERDLLLARRKGTHFSAAVCYVGLKAFILLNDSGGRKRQASDLAHELAHIILRHKAENPFQDGGIRDFSENDEQEAEMLGPILLVSEAAALRAYRLISSNQHTLDSLSDEWGISKQVILLRINKVGAKNRVGLVA